MPVREIADLVATLDEDRCSPVADQVAAAWGYRPGEARFRRSSASHVFAVPGGFLRFAGRHRHGHDALVAAAGLAERLADAGLAARPVRATGGELVAAVRTQLGVMHATVLATAPGEEVDEDELTVAQAQRWGAALAALHATAAPLAAELALPDGLDALPAGEGPLGQVLERIRAALAELPRTMDTVGPTHGDFELDNLHWAGDAVVAFDFDEAALSWYAADVEAALRDRVGTAAGAAFLAGYRAVRPLSAAEEAALPLFAAARAAALLYRLPAIVAGAPAVGDPPWVPGLCSSLAAAGDDCWRLVGAWRGSAAGAR